MSNKILVNVIFILLIALIGCSEPSEMSDTPAGVSNTTFSSKKINSPKSERQESPTSQTWHTRVEENNTIKNPESEMNTEERCSENNPEVKNSDNDLKSTDVLWGSVYRSRDGEPLSVEVTGFETRPDLLPIDIVDEGSLVLFAELLDSSGRTVHRYPFTMGGEPHVDNFFSEVLPGTVFPNRHRKALFQVFMPNPPEYDKIAITYSGKELRVVERFSNFSETCFKYNAEENDTDQLPSAASIQTTDQEKCQLDTIDIPERETTAKSTDFIWGTMHVTSDGEPLRLESIEVRTYPGLWEPVEPDDRDNIFDIELRDASGESVYSAPIMVLGNWNAEFLVRIPDPPQYESIAILDSGQEIGEVWKSPNSPEIEISRPAYGSVFCYEDVLRMLDFIRLSWSSDDMDQDELEYDIWISTDGGETYEFTNTLRGNFHPSDLYEADEIYARVYVTDGRNTAFDETYFVLDHGE